MILPDSYQRHCLLEQYLAPSIPLKSKEFFLCLMFIVPTEILMAKVETLWYPVVSPYQIIDHWIGKIQEYHSTSISSSMMRETCCWNYILPRCWNDAKAFIAGHILVVIYSGLVYSHEVAVAEILLWLDGYVTSTGVARLHAQR